MIKEPIFKDHDKLRAEFEENGYLIIPDVISKDSLKEINDLFWDYIEELSPKLSRDDSSNWMDQHKWPINTHGLIQHYNVGFQKFTIETRNHVKKVFEMIYGTDRLITSFDGVSFTKRRKVYKYKDLKDYQNNKWEKDQLHIDQTIPGLRCIQSGACIIDQNEDSHVFVCIPGSHKYHEQLLSKMDTKTKASNWYILSQEDKVFMRENGLNITRVPMKAGSVVIWDSRTVHASTGFCRSSLKYESDIPYRLQIFVCMKPLDDDSQISPKERQRRIKAYLEGRVSRHIPDQIELMTKSPRKYGNLSDYDTLNIPESYCMSDQERKLHGLIDY
jgi:ectoine hydroxylase-related dioxygenase (phytanoyl-CoA dioxygenase family)